MNLQINAAAFGFSNALKNVAQKPYQPKFNAGLLKDSVSFGESPKNNYVEPEKIKRKDIEALQKKDNDEIKKFFIDRNPLGETAFWRMTPKAIKASAELLKEKGLDDVLMQSFTALDINSDNILSTVSNHKKLDAITEALKDSPECLIKVLSYPSPSQATEIVLKNSEDEDEMIKSLNNAWSAAVKAEDKKAAYNLLKENANYLNKRNIKDMYYSEAFEAYA